MKPLSLFSTVLSLALALAASAQDTPSEQLRVLCYNIHYGQGTDGVYDVERLAKVINDAKPDLVALQEVDVHVERSGRIHQASRLAELTGMAIRFGPTQHYQGGLFGNAVLTKLPILDVLIQPLPYTESTPELVTYPRAAIAVTVEVNDGKPLRFISTHFQHNVPVDRLAEAKSINQHFGNDDLRTILAGDFNAKPDSEPILELEKHWTHAASEPYTPTAPSKNPRSRIDYITYRPAEAFKVVREEVIDEPLASDHCPVFAVFSLN